MDREDGLAASWDRWPIAIHPLRRIRGQRREVVVRFGRGLFDFLELLKGKG